MLKVLIVDDSEGWRIFNKNSLIRIFGEENLSLTFANSATEGSAKIMFSSVNPFDLIITDLQMESDYAPMSAGEWFVSQVQSFPEYFKSKILIISAMYNIEMVAESLNVDFLSKRMLISSDVAFELKLKEIRGTKSRCILEDQKLIDGKCIVCGEEAKHLVAWGIQY